MADAIVSRLGQINQAGAADALFLKLYAGEVLAAMERTQVMTAERHFIRSISQGKSSQFPRTGYATAKYHTPGQELLGSKISHGEVVITIDDLLVTDSFIANWDEAVNHYDVRSIYTNEMGEALANAMDKHILQTGILGARSSNPITSLPGGTKITTATVGAPASADYKNNGAHLAAALFMAARVMDENNIPQEGRTAYVRPAQYYNLASTTQNINQDWRGLGSYSDGKIIRIAGIEIVKTNNLPSTAITAGSVDAGTGNKYQVDATNTQCLIAHKSALATLKLMDLGLESEYQVSRQGTLMVAKLAVAHGVLRPEGLIEVSQSAT